MEALHINSERGTISETITGPGLGNLGKFFEATLIGSGKRRHNDAKGRGAVRRRSSGKPTSFPLLVGNFESSASPKLGAARLVVFGGASFKIRLIEDHAYVGSPLLAAMDGGRQWLAVSAAELAEKKAKSESGRSSLTEPIGSLEGGEVETGFGKLAALLQGAKSVRVAGPATVDGQQTTKIEGELASKQLTEGLPSSLSRLQKQRLGHMKGSLDFFVASDGLPVRTRLRIGVGKVAVVTDMNILATEIPILVAAPPAAETITSAELKKHEEAEKHDEAKVKKG